MSPQGYPDLVVSFLDPPSVTVPYGQQLTIMTKVKNQGNASAGSSTLGWYASPNPSFHGTWLTDSTVGSLSAGATSSLISRTFTVDNSLGEPGDVLYFFTKADWSNNIDEGSNEENNYSDDTLSPGYVQVTVGNPQYHDLQVTSISVDDDTPTPGQTITVNYTVENNGDKTSSCDSFVNSVRWSTDSSIALSDPEIGSKNMSGVSGGQSRSDSIQVTVPQDAQPGVTYYVGVYADSTDSVSESNGQTSYEGNNTKYLIISSTNSFHDQLWQSISMEDKTYDLHVVTEQAVTNLNRALDEETDTPNLKHIYIKDNCAAVAHICTRSKKV